ncbi:phenoloxidase-activating enzyme-like [Hyposmocoma kahamanoa]|uniref:phenoloxidase-activating enzyme-like n=1 Tax=Hyposmocoma kahamanoa TaxID=1477025 RepID=UPI000E6D7B7D|nr:phenoloxidase-activating enzyme-like [Hyposmocoma kahamanoa]
MKTIVSNVFAFLVATSCGHNVDNDFKNSMCEETEFPPDPSSQCCGIDTRSSNSIIDGYEASVRQYPWVALLEYEMNGFSSTTLCGGFLISSYYVMTAAHCVTGEMFDNRKVRLVNVILGEYDITNHGKDCARDIDGVNDCTDGAISIPVEDIQIHPSYSGEISSQGDIALIRLAKAAPYTDFIRPICLPKENIYSYAEKDLVLLTSGWGVSKQSLDMLGWFDMKDKLSPVKLHVEVPYIPLEKCKSQLPVSNEHICAGDVGKRSCGGDSGGPLMYELNGQYEAVGVTSYGSDVCAVLPIVYTNVYSNLPWIEGVIFEEQNSNSFEELNTNSLYNYYN